MVGIYGVLFFLACGERCSKVKGGLFCFLRIRGRARRGGGVRVEAVYRLRGGKERRSSFMG